MNEVHIIIGSSQHLLGLFLIGLGVGWKLMWWMHDRTRADNE